MKWCSLFAEVCILESVVKTGLNASLCRAEGLMFGSSLHLHPYFVYASSKGSGETAHLCRLILVFLFLDNIRPPDECVLEIYFLYFASKTYVVGAQKNRLNEMVLLSTQNMFKSMGKKIITILRS